MRFKCAHCGKMTPRHGRQPERRYCSTLCHSKRIAYQAAWYRKNIERLRVRARVYMAEYRNKNRVKMNAAARDARQKNPERKREAVRAYYLRNREKECARARAYYHQNRQKMRAANALYRSRNREKLLAYMTNYHRKRLYGEWAEAALAFLHLKRTLREEKRWQ